MSATVSRKIKSAERTLALLELFSREQRPFTVGRISEALGIPQPSVSMLLRNLRELGYLEYDALTRTFTPSIRVALLGSWVDRSFGEANAVAHRLSVVQQTLGYTSFIGIQNGAAAQYVLSQTSHDPDRLDIASGQYRSLTCTAMGRALLMLKPDREVISWVRRCNAEAEEERFKVREADFLQMIRAFRAQGYAETLGDSIPGQGAIAMTFASPMGRMPLAVGVGGRLARIQDDKARILATLREFKAAFEDAGEHHQAAA